MVSKAGYTRSERGASDDRVLATVLCTEIVGSGEHVVRRHHELVRAELAQHGGVEVDSAGDGFLASFDGPLSAIRCACAVTRSVRDLGLELRVGLPTGECEGTVRDLVAGSGLAFDDRGIHDLEGIPGEWHLFAVRPAEPPGLVRLLDEEPTAEERRTHALELLINGR